MKKFDFNYLNLFKLSHLNLLFKDFFEINGEIKSDYFHLRKAIDWLLNAKNTTQNGGISLGYSLISGWFSSYPETSGYIVPTLLDYYEISKYKFCLKSSRDIAEWLCGIQFRNGGFPKGFLNFEQNPSIFNTGQIIFGLLKAYNKFEINNFLKSAIKAGEFLINNQEKNGSWIKYTYFNNPHTYNVRTAWALLELYSLSDNKDFLNAALKNLNWALHQVNKNYWFCNNSFYKNQDPILHFICYTIRGFLEAGLILEDETFITVATKSASKLLDYFIINRNIPATFNFKWESQVNYLCLTGLAQLAIIWLKIYLMNKEKKYLENSLKLNTLLKSIQTISKNKNFDGALKGSHPIWGNYMKFIFPNWATKFFCDSIMLENKILKI